MARTCCGGHAGCPQGPAAQQGRRRGRLGEAAHLTGHAAEQEALPLTQPFGENTSEKY